LSKQTKIHIAPKSINESGHITAPEPVRGWRVRGAFVPGSTLQNCSVRAVLCTTVVHNDTHTRVNSSYIFAC